MSPRVRLVVVGGVMGLVVVIAIIWLAILSPRLSESARLEQQAIDLETANLGLLNTYNTSIDLARQAPQAAAEAQRLFDAMPQQADLPRVLEQITQAATDAGIDPGDIQTITTTIPTPVAPEGEETAGVALASLQLAVTAEGTRAQTLAFLDNLQRLDRVLLVTSSRLLEAPVEGSKDRWTMQITGTMFVLQSGLPDLVQEVADLMAASNLPAKDPPTAP